MIGNHHRGPPSLTPCPIGCGREGDRIKERIWETVRGRLLVRPGLSDAKGEASGLTGAMTVRGATAAQADGYRASRETKNALTG